MEIYVLIDPDTGKLWKKSRYGHKRGVYAYKSEAKALATLKQSAGPYNAVAKKFVMVEDDVPSMNFVKFTDTNDNEGESWNFWLQFDGNEVELKKLERILGKFDEGGETSYSLDMSLVPESEVNSLVKYTDSGYMDYNNKVTGIFTCPTLSKSIDVFEMEDEISDEAFEWLDQKFYKGEIQRYFD